MFKKGRLLTIAIFMILVSLAFQGSSVLADSDPFAALVEGVAHVGMPDGIPGPLKALFDGPEKIVFGDEDAYSIPDSVERYEAGDYPPIVMATEFGKGRVIVGCQEGYFTEKNINRYDNLELGLNSIKWLDRGENRRVLYDNRSWPYPGYAGPGVYSGLGTALAARGYIADRFSVGGEITINTLTNYDVYMICTSWYAFSPSEINAIVQFVANGGGLFLTGLGWSWVLYQGPLDEYPMNKIASRFGIWFMDGSILDPTDNIGGEACHPLYHTFYSGSSTPEGRGSMYPAINALFDSYHRRDLEGSGRWFDDHYPGEFRSSYLTSPITYNKLKSYDLFVFHGSYKPELGPRPTNDEAIAVLQYVQDGGAVIICGEDNYWNLWSNDYPNVLAEKFGIQFNTDRVLDPTDYDVSVWGSEGGAERHIVIRSFTDHPITSGLGKILLHGACSIVVHNPNAVILASGDEDAYSDVYSGYPPGSRPPVAVALEHGRGRILFVGDGWSHEVGGYDNKEFTLNALAWVAGSHSRRLRALIIAPFHTVLTLDDPVRGYSKALVERLSDADWYVKPLFDGKATKEAILREFQKPYDLIHITTHGGHYSFRAGDESIDSDEIKPFPSGSRPLVYLAYCHSNEPPSDRPDLKDGLVPLAFVEKGASACVGFTNYIYFCKYLPTCLCRLQGGRTAYDVAKNFYDRLAAGLTVEQAVKDNCACSYECPCNGNYDSCLKLTGEGSVTLDIPRSTE